MKSLSSSRGGSYCKPRHAELAALYVLPHRMKKAEIPESQSITKVKIPVVPVRKNRSQCAITPLTQWIPMLSNDCDSGWSSNQDE